jgi:hypothetical protein
MQLPILPGELVYFIEERQFMQDPFQRAVWEGVITNALLSQGLVQWQVKWASFPTGDSLLTKGLTEQEQLELELENQNFQVIAIAEEKWDVPDVRSSITDGRFFGDENQVKRLAESGAVNDQYVLATVDDPESDGVLQSLHRDYSPYMCTITSMERYAAFMATFARRFGQPVSTKGTALRKKRKLPLAQEQLNALSYYFTDGIARQMLMRFNSTEEALNPLKSMQFKRNRKGNQVPIMPDAYIGIKFLGPTYLIRAWRVYVQDRTQVTV